MLTLAHASLLLLAPPSRDTPRLSPPPLKGRRDRAAFTAASARANALAVRLFFALCFDIVFFAFTCMLQIGIELGEKEGKHELLK